MSSRVPLIDRLIATSTYRLMDTLGEVYFANARSLRIFEKLVPCYRPCSRGRYSVICGGDFGSFPRRWQLTAVRGKRVYDERVVNECPRCFLESITRLSRNRCRETLFRRIISFFLSFSLRFFYLGKGSIEIRDTNNYISSIKMYTNIFKDFIRFIIFTKLREIYTREV